MHHAPPSPLPSGAFDAGACPDLPGRLRQAIAVDHLAIETLPVTRAMMEGNLSLGAYGRLLANLEPVHAAIEERVDREAALRRIFDGPLVRRHSALACDLVHWGMHDGRSGASAERLVAWIAGCTGDEAVGACYVIAGSCLGAAVLAPRLAAAFKVPLVEGAGLDYQFVAPDTLMPAWRLVKQRLTDHGAAAGRHPEACAGARAMMRGMFTVYAECAA